MSGIGSPIRIRVVRSKYLQFAAWLCDPVQLSDETKHIRNVLDHVAANDLFKLIVAERIGKGSEIVNDVCMASRVRVDADRAGKLVLTTANIKNFFLSRCRCSFHHALDSEQRG